MMDEIVERFQEYVATYKPKNACGMESVFVKDMLYGIGLALKPEMYRYGSGFDLWLRNLQKHLVDRHSVKINHNDKDLPF